MRVLRDIAAARDGAGAQPLAPAVLAPLGFLALALLAYAMAGLAPGEAGPLVLRALAVGLLGLAVLRLAGAMPLRRGARAGHGFEALYGALAEPAALTNRQGEVLAANRALRDLCGGDRPRAMLALLGADAASAEEEVYQTLRELRLRGEARRRVHLAGARRLLAVTRAGGDTLLWRFAPLDEAARLSARVAQFDGLGVAVAVAGGGAVAVNTTLMRSLRKPPERAEDLFAEPPETSGDIARLRHPAGDDGLRRVFFEDEEDGDLRVYLMAPCVADEAEVANVEDILETLPVPLARLTLDGALISANSTARRLLGPSAATGAAIGDLIEGLGRSVAERVIEAARGNSTGRSEMARGRREDKELFLQVSFSRIVLRGEPGLIAVLSDATELKTLEAQFVQSQKMQAVGQLAGGVAHDFNNLLTAINGHCDLLLLRHEAGDADHADLVQIRQNSQRAAALVKQMLAFSRKQTLRPKLVNLVDTLSELSHLLNRLLGEKVRLVLETDEEVGLVRVDAQQFEQVIMNLVVNARDAMREGGDVRIATRNVSLTEELRRDRAVIPVGDYVLVEVSDTGHGIPPDKIGKIFEPFFSTKKVGEGTGLGLSTAYGIVKQTGGFIFVDSAAGSGTRFSIYLPRCEENALPPPPAPPDRSADLTGAGVVLLVEDEAPVRSFATRALKLRGYDVIEADCAEVALETLEDADLHVDVIVSDVVMPGMDGPTWVRTALERRPGVKVIFVSGYAEDAFQKNLKGLEDFHFLPKPFSLTELTTAIKEALSPQGEAAA